MDEGLKKLFYAHLTEMVFQAAQVNPSLKVFYRQNGSKEEVFKKLDFKGQISLQKKLDRLFPDEFRVQAGLVSFTERSKHEKMVEKRASLRQQRLEAHILATQKAAQIHFENHWPPTKRDQKKLRPLVRKSRGKNCPTCGVEMLPRNGIHGFTVEHIVPVRYGGKNTYDGEFPQCVGMCYLCNQTRNNIVLAIGREEIRGRTRMTDRAIRFLITQIYGERDQVDSQMAQLFSEQYQLVSSQEIAVEEYDLWGIGEWVEYQIPPEEKSTPHLTNIPDTEEDDVEPVYLDLNKEQTVACLKRDLKKAIEVSNKNGKPYSVKRLERLWLKHGSPEQFREKIGMQNEDIDVILFRLYPHQFILETKGTVRYIHALENEGRHFYDFSAEVAIPPLTKTLNEEELVVAETVHATPVPVPMPVLFVRDALAPLHLSDELNEVPFERIKEILDGLRKEDGMDWDTYLDFFNIVPSGSLAERINLLLAECGFKCHLKKDNQNLFFVFEPPHDFEQH
ncbi:HNH endonuclease [Candidatus Poseidoniaceae archaeon]|nr:HNH endonuclease [Candidatus Poseidoniaceae archaeon]